MNKISLFFLITILLHSPAAFGGFNKLTTHSRANCVNNESISWDWTHEWVLLTTSDHINARSGAVLHSLSTGWENTWRSAAVHWGEGSGGWLVHGVHWIKNASGFLKIGEEIVDDCSIYDGWWDQDK
jgi:hypothetical protein